MAGAVNFQIDQTRLIRSRKVGQNPSEAVGCHVRINELSNLHKSVGVTWNSNATDIIDGKLDEGFDLLKPFIKSCHINDLTNDKAGKYPYRDLFKKLRGIGYDRYTMCEVGKTYEPEAGLKFLTEYKELWDSLVAPK